MTLIGGLNQISAIAALLQRLLENTYFLIVFLEDLLGNYVK